MCVWIEARKRWFEGIKKLSLVLPLVPSGRGRENQLTVAGVCVLGCVVWVGVC